MTRFRSTYLLIGLFVVLLLFVVFFENDNKDLERRQEQESTPYYTTEMVDQIEELTFSKAEETLTIKRDGEDYFSVMSADRSYRIDPAEEEQLLQELKELPLGSVASRNQDNWDKYGVGEGSDRIRIRLSGDEDSELFIGNPATSYGSSYMRRN